MRAGPMLPSTRIDLTAPEVVADPYPFFAEERRRHPVAWYEPGGSWLVFDHAGVSAVLRDRRFGRLWTDREPRDRLEPFNLLHRNQMMENEPPAHTRLRRHVSSAFNRGHVERLRPRVQELAAGLDEFRFLQTILNTDERGVEAFDVADLQHKLAATSKLH